MSSATAYVQMIVEQFPSSGAELAEIIVSVKGRPNVQVTNYIR